MPFVERGRKSGERLVGEAYPTQYGTGIFTPLSRDDDARTSAEATEIHGIKCAQCGFPIEDYRAIDECPHCESDNFLGLQINSET